MHFLVEYISLKWILCVNLKRICVYMCEDNIVCISEKRI
jgi:hypothetical protein